MNKDMKLNFNKDLNDIVIFLIEDDLTTIKVYTNWLEKLGAKVLSFSSYSDFQNTMHNKAKLLQEYSDKIFVAFTDFILPDASGIEVVSLWAKNMQQYPIIIVTAFATIENAVQAMRMGAFDFLRKPISSDTMLQILIRAREYALLLKENDNLSLSVRVLGMAQTISQITDRTNLLKTLGRVLLREVKAEEVYVFYRENLKTHPECLLDSRVPGISRVQPEVVYTHILSKIFSESGQKLHIEGIDPNTMLEPKFYNIEEANSYVIELSSQTGNCAYIVLIGKESSAMAELFNGSLKPVVVQASRSFQNAEVASALSFVDDLTGLYNQRFLHVTLQSEISRALRYNTNISVLFVDLDYFKNINDKFGHIVGSQILKEASKIFRLNVRDCDYLLRFGGDEFVAILPSTSLAGGLTVAERVRESFDKTLFDVREQTNIADAQNINITVSIGVASFPECANSVQDIIHRADEAMYISKNSGKNRVTAAEKIS